MYAHVDLAILSRLPKFDIVLFSSVLQQLVLQHLMRAHGVNYYHEVLRIIRSKTYKVMIFDMGIKSELSDWAKDLASATEEASAPIDELIRSAGFSQVDLIGHTTALRGRVARQMLRAFP